MARLALIEDVFVPPKRQRLQFDEEKMQELISSIEEHGLLHPPVVAPEGGKFRLVAGERRFRAIKELNELGMAWRHDGEYVPAGFIPVTKLGELSPLSLREAELEENIRRVDLSWQERVAAEAELMQLRAEKAAAEGKPAPKPIDLAEELRGKANTNTAQSVQQALVLAKNLHRPEVAAAKSQTDAWKALNRVETAERNADVARALGKDHLSGKHRLVQGDSVEWMKGQEAAQFDVICTDPPYGMGADSFGDSGGKMHEEHFYSDDESSWVELMAAAIPELSRLAKKDAHLYLFCDIDRFPTLRLAVEDNGWTPFRTPLIWFKPSAFRAPWPEKGPQRKYECILYAVRGDLKCLRLGGDVLQHSPDENLGHPAQKPVALLKDLLSRSVRPGMKILDPFCGSGGIFEAGNDLSAIVTGVELDEKAAGIAAGRLENLRASKS